QPRLGLAQPNRPARQGERPDVPVAAEGPPERPGRLKDREVARAQDRFPAVLDDPADPAAHHADLEVLGVGAADLAAGPLDVPGGGGDLGDHQTTEPSPAGGPP